MFWRVAGFSSPSPLEQILDKDEFTLEELLDEDDIIQECKSLNGRLVAFLREPSTVEQLLRYVVESAVDCDDLKRAYKYPFTACEVFCCEVEAVFTTLLEDPSLMKLLFSLLDNPFPLNCKTAGYFGRVVTNLLVRRTNEMVQYLQENPALIEQLVTHVDTTSIADILKRIVGGDEQFSVAANPACAQWLSETALVDLLLARLAQNDSAEAQTNAADILSAIAHTQPSPLATKLTKDESIAALFQHAMSPSRQVLVPALDVCIALVEPRRSMQQLSAESSGTSSEALIKAQDEAIHAIVQHLPKLVELLQPGSHTGSQETPYGVLSPPLGRARLKIVEMLAVLLRSGSAAAESAVMASCVITLCLQLFSSYPFNNLLHRSVTAMLLAVFARASQNMIQHLFVDCHLLDWLLGLPLEVRPTARAGHEEAAASKPALRAGYLGHVTQIGTTLESMPAQQGSLGAPESFAVVASFLEGHDGWHTFLEEYLHPQQNLENTTHWACGRPTATSINVLDSDGDEFQHDMDMEHIQEVPPALFYRYNLAVDEAEEEEEEAQHPYQGNAFGMRLITEHLAGMELGDGPKNTWEEHIGEELDREGDAQAQLGHGEAAVADQGMEGDDEVLLATSDDDVEETAMASDTNDFSAVHEEQGAAQAHGLPDDMVIVEEEAIPEAMDGNNDLPVIQNHGPGGQPQLISKSPGGVGDPPEKFNDLNFWKPTFDLGLAENK